MSDWLETVEGEEEEYSPPTFAEAKEEFEFWIEQYSESQRDWPKEYRFRYKKGRDPDVLAYIILSSDEKLKIQN